MRLDAALRSIYDSLFLHYGPQHWWPAETPFEVIIGAILTQSTAWTNVEKAIANLKAAGKLSPAALRRISVRALAALIRPCGYYNVKTRRLKAFVVWLGARYGDDLDKLFTGDIGEVREHLLDIYGIGQETADSILLYAGGRPVFVVDAYTRRTIDRLGLAPVDRSYTGYQQLFMANLPADTALFNEYHALIVRHAKEFCRQRPLCGLCFLGLKKRDRQEKTGGPYPCRESIK